MPGIKDLTLFRNELSRLGKEREVMAERGETYEEMPLPSAVPLNTPELDVDSILSSLGNGAEEELGTGPADDGPDLSSFDSLLADLPLEEPDLSPQSAQIDTLPEISGEQAFDIPMASGPADVPEIEGFDDFSMPADLLAGFGAEIEAGRLEDSLSPVGDAKPETTFESPIEADGTDLLDLEALENPEPESERPADLTDNAIIDSPFPETPEPLESFGGIEDAAVPEFTMPDFDAPEEPDALESLGDLDVPDAEFKLPDFGAGDDIEFPSIPDFEMEAPPTGFSPAAASEEIADFSIPDLEETTDSGFGQAPSGMFDVDSIPGLDASPGKRPGTPEPVGAKSGFDQGFADFSIPDDLSIAEPESPAAVEMDSFDGFSMDEDFLKSSADDDEFHIPGFSDFTGDSSKKGFPDFGAGIGRSGKKEIPLTISDEDFRFLMDTVSGYPLNLRLAVEEFITGDEGTELQKMELVHQIVTKAPIRKVASTVGKLLSRVVEIPKDYEKKSVADWEKEKTSLKYVFINRILPAMILFTIIATLTACTLYLSYRFIYKPIVAERLYREGYDAIEEGLYSQAISRFNEAVRFWDMKKWYFRYARAFREKRQYIAAEDMYERILSRFNNDKAAGLEYAEMLRSDLRNFEKAVMILRRKVLDNYVNDKAGLMLLGDTYLDWAEDDSSKFEEARKVYASLIELYGRSDEYLVRMMRYFIRTNNLAQVLPLKEHFMSKKAKIGSDDLIELSGYLLDKRYNPLPEDAEFLRNQIDDLRILLERAVKADSRSPEAHYNMGRFFLYNYNSRLADLALNESLQRFSEVRQMYPKRILRNIDAFRLLGGIRAADREYLKAEALYTQGISMYQEYSANRSVRQDPLVGKLYAEFADIHYFISNDLDTALINYTRATEELNDTPSIRYRMGYIRYQKADYENSMREMTLTHAQRPSDRNLLFGFANTLFRRGDYFAAQGYYERLMAMLEAERVRKGILFPQVRTDHGEFVELYMKTGNNLGVTLNRLARRTGNPAQNSRALAELSESTRAWDALSRNQETMVRATGTNLAYLNIQNITHSRPDYIPEIYADIPKTLENEKILQQRVDR